MGADGREIMAAGFGTGGNPAKLIGPDFEAGTLAALVADGPRVLLSRGVGAAGPAATEAVCAALVGRGLRVLHFPEGQVGPGTDADVVTWQADPG